MIGIHRAGFFRLPVCFKSIIQIYNHVSSNDARLVCYDLK